MRNFAPTDCRSFLPFWLPAIFSISIIILRIVWNVLFKSQCHYHDWIWFLAIRWLYSFLSSSFSCSWWLVDPLGQRLGTKSDSLLDFSSDREESNSFDSHPTGWWPYMWMALPWIGHPAQILKYFVVYTLITIALIAVIALTTILWQLSVQSLICFNNIGPTIGTTDTFDIFSPISNSYYQLPWLLDVRDLPLFMPRTWSIAKNKSFGEFQNFFFLWVRLLMEVCSN